jgi:hypothetical protein
MVKKLRIQLFNENGTPISDRLVEQNTEFYQGPKEKHQGPIRIEFSLENQEDVSKSILYLQKLATDMPLEVKKTENRGRKPGDKTFQMDNSREVLLAEAYSTSKNQDEFIKTLRGHDFIFMDSDRLRQLIPEAYEIKDRHFDKYQWLVRVAKKAKDPRNDKMDLALLIGIVIMDQDNRDPKMVIYLNGTLKETLKLEIPKNAITFKQTNLIKYPHYMLYEEREKWGVEHRLLLSNPDKQPSKFYLRWSKDITVGDELKLPEKRLKPKK